jgi:hypothetical protein
LLREVDQEKTISFKILLGITLRGGNISFDGRIYSVFEPGRGALEAEIGTLFKEAHYLTR